MYTVTPTSTVNSAGNNRRARRAQKPPKLTRPLRSCSPISSSVIR